MELLLWPHPRSSPRAADWACARSGRQSRVKTSLSARAPLARQMPRTAKRLKRKTEGLAASALISARRRLGVCTLGAAEQGQDLPFRSGAARPTDAAHSEKVKAKDRGTGRIRAHLRAPQAGRVRSGRRVDGQRAGLVLPTICTDVYARAASG